MAINSSAVQKKAADVVASGMPLKAVKLVMKAAYEAPKVISFPIDGTKFAGALTGMGQTGGSPPP